MFFGGPAFGQDGCVRLLALLEVLGFVVQSGHRRSSSQTEIRKSAVRLAICYIQERQHFGVHTLSVWWWWWF